MLGKCVDPDIMMQPAVGVLSSCCGLTSGSENLSCTHLSLLHGEIYRPAVTVDQEKDRAFFTDP
jgi:hypothetical protein